MKNLTLRRADIVALSGMPARQFDAALHRGQVPWSAAQRERSWGSFTTEQAYRVALMHEFTVMGLPYADAATTVRASFEDLIAGELQEKGADRLPLMFGFFITQTPVGIEDGVRLRMPLIARLAELGSEFARLQGPMSEVTSMMAVDATAVMRRLLERARAADLKDPRLTALARKVGAL